MTLANAIPRNWCRRCWPPPDILLVTLRDVPLFATFIPSKMFEYLAAGRPVIGAVAGEAAQILREAGAVVVPPGDSAALAAAIGALAADPRRRGRSWPRRAGPTWSASSTAAELARQYRKILRRRARPRRSRPWEGGREAAGDGGQRLPGRVRAARGGRGAGTRSPRWPAARAAAAVARARRAAGARGPGTTAAAGGGVRGRPVEVLVNLASLGFGARSGDRRAPPSGAGYRGRCSCPPPRSRPRCPPRSRQVRLAAEQQIRGVRPGLDDPAADDDLRRAGRPEPVPAAAAAAPDAGAAGARRRPGCSSRCTWPTWPTPCWPRPSGPATGRARPTTWPGPSR